MLTYKPTAPYTLGLITTFRCNASCENCGFGCRPHRGRTMTLDEMKHYVDICLEAYPDTIRRLSLTGGECFLLGTDLDEIVAYGTSRGLSVGLVSNGYWGVTYKQAFERMAALKACGLRDISFSVGDDHDHIIPFRNCRNAAVAAARLGYKVDFRMECSRFGKCPVYDRLESDKPFMRLVSAGKIALARWEWRTYNNEVIHGRSNAWRWRPYEESKPCHLLLRSIEITPYGDVLACSGIGVARNPHMRLGNIWEEPVKLIYERAFADLLKVWIQRNGAQRVLQFVYDNSEIKFHQCGNGCESCIEIFENPKILPFLREHYDDWASKIF